MANILVRDRQTAIDIAMQHHGSADAALDVCLTNNISITEALQTDKRLIAASITNAYVVKIYNADGIIPVSSAGVMPGGIGAWAVGLDFIVN